MNPKENLTKDNPLLKIIRCSEEQIKQGKCVRANTSLKDREIDNLLMNRYYKNNFRK